MSRKMTRKNLEKFIASVTRKSEMNLQYRVVFEKMRIYLINYKFMQGLWRRSIERPPLKQTPDIKRFFSEVELLTPIQAYHLGEQLGEQAALLSMNRLKSNDMRSRRAGKEKARPSTLSLFIEKVILDKDWHHLPRKEAWEEFIGLLETKPEFTQSFFERIYLANLAETRDGRNIASATVLEEEGLVIFDLANLDTLPGRGKANRQVEASCKDHEAMDAEGGAYSEGHDIRYVRRRFGEIWKKVKEKEKNQDS